MGNFGGRRGTTGRRTLVILGIIAVALYVVLRACTVVVPAGARGVVFSKSAGVRQGALDEGLHLIVPFVWEVRLYDVRSQTYTLGSTVTEAELAGGEPVVAQSSDGQNVTLDISVRFHLDPEQVWRIHRDVGEDYVAKIIKPQVRSDARMVTATYPGVELYSTERYALQTKIDERIRTALAQQDLIVEEVLVRNISFSPQFQQAIEQKQIAQQNALRMDYVVKKQQEEKKKAIILARGEAESIKLKGHALASYPEIVQWEYVNGLPADTHVVVTDSQTIINLGELFRSQGGQQPQQQPAAPAR